MNTHFENVFEAQTAESEVIFTFHKDTFAMVRHKDFPFAVNILLTYNE